jgi:type I restriction enzyme, S subunit
MSETVQIPKGWKEFQIEEIASRITKGSTPSTHGHSYQNNGTKFLRAENVLENKLNLAQTKYISKTSHEFFKRSIIRPKNVLVTIAGTIGRTSYVPVDSEEMNCNQAVAIITLNDECTPQYLSYFLNSNNAKKQILDFKVHSSISNLSLELIGKIKITLPSLSTQKKIVQKLDDILGQLEEKKKQIIELKDKRKATISQLSQKTIGGIILNYMKIDNPPQNWQVKTIDECVDIQPGFAQGQKNIPDGTIHLRMNNIGRNFQLNFDKVRTINATKKQLEKYRLEKGDLIFNNTNSPELVGKSFLFNDERLCLYSNHLTRCRVKKDLILPEWLLFYIRGKWLRRDFERMCNKWINQAAVGGNKFKKMQIPIPSLTEQKQILKILTNASKQFEKISDFEKTIKIRDTQNQILLQKIQSSILDVAFSGKLVQ